MSNVQKRKYVETFTIVMQANQLQLIFVTDFHNKIMVF